MAMSGWGMLSPQDQTLAQVGMSALQSGAISPEEAAKHASSYFGLDPNMGMTPNGNQAPSGGGASQKLSPILDMSQNPMAGLNPKQMGARQLSTQTGTQNKTQKSAKNTYLSPEEYMSLRSTVASTPEMQDQMSGADQLEKLFNMNQGMARAQGPDLSPMMAGVDALTGSHLAQSYTAPESPQAMAQRLAAFAENIQGKRADISKQIMSGVKDLKSGSVQDAYMQALKEANTAGYQNPTKAPNPNAGVQNYDKFVKAVNADKNYQTSIQMQPKINELSQAIKENKNPAELNNMALGIIKLYGVGRPSNQELSQEKGSKAIFDKLDQMYQTASAGNLSPQNQKFYQDFMGQIDKANRVMMKLRHDRLSKVGTHYGLDQKAIEDTLTGEPGTVNEIPGFDMTAATAPNTPPPATGPHGPSVIQNGHTFKWNPATKEYE